LTFIPADASDFYFFGAAMVINFIQGIGGSVLQICGQAIVLQKFGAKREVGLAYLSAARGLGFLGGPLLG
jgi:MFS family permease